MNYTVSRLVACLAVLLAADSLLGQDKEKKDRPKLIVPSALAVSPGQTVTLQIRGRKLDNAERVELPGVEPASEVSLKKKEKTGVPNQMTPEQVGDTLVEFELKLPDTLAGESIPIVVHTPDGATEPYELLVVASDGIVAETEPNDSFRQPQAVDAGKTIAGVIQPKDPEVFRVSAKAGQKITAEVIAARRGSAVDGILSAFDSSGRLLASSDDTAESVDPVLSLTAPVDGDYLLVLQDAHDRGGGTHPYLFRATVE
jgi:hypothetical protein